MADLYAGPESSSLDLAAAGALRRCRGRPRLTDTDRAQRRLESRKKYDVRRVYLGESHRRWTDLRGRTGLSDAGLAEYLILLDATYGEKQHRHLGYVIVIIIIISISISISMHKRYTVKYLHAAVHHSEGCKLYRCMMKMMKMMRYKIFSQHFRLFFIFNEVKSAWSGHSGGPYIVPPLHRVIQDDD